MWIDELSVHPDMTIASDWDVKNQTKPKQNDPTPLDMYNELFQAYCIKPEGRIH